MTVSVNGTTIPESIRTRGRYQFKRAELRKSAVGVGYRAGTQSVTWSFSIMEASDWNWWVARCSGNPSVTLTSAVLWDDANIEQSFTSGELYWPTNEGVEGAAYVNVIVQIDFLGPLL
jgi:hypothetical protein